MSYSSVVPKKQEEDHSSSVFMDTNGRYWTAKAIDQLIVGRLFGKYTPTPISIYLSSLQHNLSSVTADELEDIFNTVVNEHPFKDWSSRPRTDEAVQKVLDEIRGVLDHKLHCKFPLPEKRHGSEAQGYGVLDHKLHG